MPRVPLKNKKYYTVSVPHTVTRQQICTVIWGGRFFGFFFVRVQIKPKILQE